MRRGLGAGTHSTLKGSLQLFNKLQSVCKRILKNGAANKQFVGIRTSSAMLFCVYHLIWQKIS